VVLQAPPTQREALLLEGRFRAIVNSWRTLGNDAEDARRAVLGIAPQLFASEYIYPEETGSRLADRYVTEFSMRMLETLALESRKVARDALDKLREMSRFPLAKPVKGKGVLNQQEIAQARALFGKIKVAEQNPGAGGGGVARPGVGQQGGKVETYLRMLRGLDLNREEKAFVDGTELLLKAIPEPGKTLRANIYWLPQKVQEGYAGGKRVPWDSFGVCEVIQATAIPEGRGINDRRLFADMDKAMAEVMAPGDPIRLRFTQTPDFKPNVDPVRIWPRLDDKDYDLTSPWTLLRLLHGTNGKRLDDGKVWHIEVPFDEKESFWIKIEFVEFDEKRKVPGVADWPEPKVTP
jgi:hypothetical protein